MVIESRLDPGRGAVVSLLVQRGTLKVGDAIVAGAHSGPRPRDARLPRRPSVKEATPGHAGRDPGLRRRPRGRRALPRGRQRARGPPHRRRARQPPEDRGPRPPRRRAGLARGRHGPRPAAASRPSSTWSLKADVAGSLEALADEIAKLPQDQVIGQPHPRRRRRHQRVRRHAGLRLRGDRHRLQRAPGGRRRRRSPSARASRSAPTRSSTR